MSDLLNTPGLDRLGLDRLIGDQQDTLYRIDSASQRRPRVADYLLLVGLPLAAVPVSWAADLHLQSTAGLLNGVSIITGGLFALLIAIFGLQTLGSTDPRMTPTVARLVRETRANVAYTTAFALLTAFVLMFVDAFSAPPSIWRLDGGMSWWTTGIVLALMTHLALNLLMVLNRIRLAFSELG